MTHASSVLLAASILALAACPDDETNAETLWLAPDGVETRVKLAEGMPPPF